MRKAFSAGARRTAGQLPVACLYCDERFRRTQERATHIRHHHPGKPYRSDLEQPHVEEPAPKPQEPVVANGELVDVLAPTPDPDRMTPKQHLMAAIAAIKRRQQGVDQELPALEKQLESLRAAQKQMSAELRAFETALASIEGTSAMAPAGTGTETART